MLIKRLLLNAFKLVGIPTLILEGYQSGQMGRAVNPLTSVFEGSNPSPSTISLQRSVKLGYAGVVQW